MDVALHCVTQQIQLRVAQSSEATARLRGGDLQISRQSRKGALRIGVHAADLGLPECAHGHSNVLRAHAQAPSKVKLLVDASKRVLGTQGGNIVTSSANCC